MVAGLTVSEIEKVKSNKRFGHALAKAYGGDFYVGDITYGAELSNAGYHGTMAVIRTILTDRREI